MTKPVRKIKRIDAQRASLDLPKFAMDSRPKVCHLAHEHPRSHWISVHETLVPCRVTMP